MEWDIGIPGIKFYHSYIEPEKVENSIISYDIENLRGALAGKISEPVEVTVGRVNEHYLDSSRVIKRAYGDSFEDDFQKFNWGFSIITDMGLEADKLDYLVALYCKSLPNRITETDFKHFLIFHTSFKAIADKKEKRDKWYDLKASWRIYAYKTPNAPPCISARSMRRIMRVNELVFELDIVKMTKDMKRQDKSANRLHMLLLDDPVISGKKASISTADIEAAYEDQYKAFEEIIKLEEEEYSQLRIVEVDRKMKEKVDREEAELQERIRRKREKEELRLKTEKEDKEKAVQRLEVIRREREANEASRKAKLVEDEAEKLRALSMPVSDTSSSSAPLEAIQVSINDDVKGVLETDAIQEMNPYEGLSATEIAALKLNEYMKEKDKKKQKERADLAAFVASRLESFKDKDKSMKKSKKVPVVAGDQALQDANAAREEVRNKRLEMDKAEKARKFEENRLFRLALESNKAAEKAISDALLESKAKRKRELLERQALEEEKKIKDAMADRELQAEYSALAKEFNIDLSSASEDVPRALDNQPKSTRLVRLEPLSEKASNKSSRVISKPGETMSKVKKQELESSRAVSNKTVPKMAKVDSIKNVGKRPESVTDRGKPVRSTKVDMRESRSQEAGSMRPLAISVPDLEKGPNVVISQLECVSETAINVIDYPENTMEILLVAEVKATEKSEDDVSILLTDVNDVSAVLEEILTEVGLANDISVVEKIEPRALFATLTVDVDTSVIMTQQEEQSEPSLSYFEDSRLSFTVQDIEDPEDENIYDAVKESIPAIDITSDSILEGKNRESYFEDTTLPPADEFVEPRQEEELPAVSINIVSADIPTYDFPEDIEESTLHVLEGYEIEQKDLSMRAISEERKNIEEDPIENAQDIQNLSSRDIVLNNEVFIEPPIDIAPISTAEITKILLPHEDQDQNQDQSVGPVIDRVLDPVLGSSLSSLTDDMASEDSISLLITTEKTVEEQPVEEKELPINDDLGYFDLDVVIKKSDGELKVHIRHDDDGQKHGLFVHGFRPGNLAEDVLNIGDEVLEVNGMDVRSKYLEDVREALNLDRLNDKVPMKIRRFKHHHLLPQLLIYQERVTSVKAKPVTPTLVTKRPLSSNELNLLPSYSIIEGAVQSPLLRGLETLKDAEFQDIAVVVTKVDGELKVHIRHDDEGDRHGLFVHGFRPGSLAETVLKIGDEVLEVNGADVQSKYLEDIIDALAGHESTEVSMKVRRHILDSSLLIKSSRSNYPGEDTQMNPIELFPSISSVNIQSSRPTTSQFKAPRPLSRQEIDHIPTFSIVENAVQSPLHLGLESLERVDFKDIAVVVTKVDGELKVHIRHDDEGDRHGLFVHGFRPGSLAETVLKIGDEVLEVNGADVQSKYLEDIIDALAGHESTEVSMKVRRRDAISAILQQGFLSHSSVLSSRSANGSSHMRISTPKMKTTRQLTPQELDHIPNMTIVEGAYERDPLHLSLEDLEMSSDYEDFAVVVTKVDGELKVHIRHDDEGDRHGLFVHGFRPGSLAETVLKIGDEVLEVNGADVQSKYLEDIIDALAGHESTEVSMKVRRHIALQTGITLIKSSRSSIMSPRVATPTTIKTHKSPTNLSKEDLDALPTFHIFDTTLVEDPEKVNLIDEDRDSEDINVIIDKIDGELKVHIRHDNDGTRNGLFVHGFRFGNPSAERLLQVGDKILAVNGTQVEYLPELIDILRNDICAVAELTIRRYKSRKHENIEIVQKVEEGDVHIENNLLDTTEILTNNLFKGSISEIPDDANYHDEDAQEECAVDMRESFSSENDPVSKEVKIPPLSTLENTEIQKDDDMDESSIGKEVQFGTVLLGDDNDDDSDDDVDEGKVSVSDEDDKEPSMSDSTPRSINLNSFEEHSFFLHKTKGSLMLLIRYDDFLDSFDDDDDDAGNSESSKKKAGGLFIHGFRSGSRAEVQGLINIGDELLELNSVDVEGKELDVIVKALAAAPKVMDKSDSDSVWTKVRRQRSFN